MKNKRGLLGQISRLSFIFIIIIGMGVAGCSETHRKPNIILIMADDLGYNELGCYGQQKIKTPNVDRLAEKGMRFTQFYSGSPVCAPSRCVLMTGMHTGHSFVRDNSEVGSWESFKGQLPIPAATRTLAEILKENGYVTAAIGKWGLGYPGTDGDPNKQGFDLFFGYNCQRHAHNYYPRYLWKNDQKIYLEGNDRGVTGKQYTPDLMEDEALAFIRENKEKPFFLYFATTVPHLALQVPENSLDEYLGQWDDPPYDGKDGYLPHPHPRAAYAAMVTRMDRTVGRIMDLIESVDLSGHTMIFFTSDNGPSYTGGYDRNFFEGAGSLRGHKGYVYEGGIRVPMVISWPGKIKEGSVTSHIGAFQDFLPTLSEMAGARASIPIDCDGVSFAGLLTGTKQKVHDHLYMEFASYGGQQMLRKGKWKAVRQNLQDEPDAPIELYDMASDISEKTDLAGKHPDVVKELWEIMNEEHVPSKAFPFEAPDKAVIPQNVH